ncbi:glycosyltransferase family 39 protein [bacterium]|nr:glycosyltransferase family 39 protein [bacterium]
MSPMSGDPSMLSRTREEFERVRRIVSPLRGRLTAHESVPPLAAALVLTAMLAVHLAIAVVWFERDRTLMGNDAADYFQHFLVYEARIAEAGSSIAGLLETWGWQERTTAPPLMFLLTWVVTRFVHTPDAARFTVFFAKIALVLFTYGAGRRMFGRDGALVAAAVVGFSPVINVLSLQFNPFVLVAASAAACAYACVASDAFRRLGPSLAFGAAAGFAAMTERGTGAIFAATVVGYGLAHRVLGRRDESRAAASRNGSPWIPVALAGAIALAIAGPYVYQYLRQGMEHVADLSATAVYPSREGNYYERVLHRHVTGALFVYAGYPFAALYLLSRQRHRFMAAAIVVAPILFFDRIATRDLEYIVAGVVGVALAIGGGYALIPWRALRWGLGALVAIAAAANAHLSVISIPDPESSLGALQRRWTTTGKPGLFYHRAQPDLRAASAAIARNAKDLLQPLFIYGYQRPGELNVTMHVLMNKMMIRVGFAHPGARHLVVLENVLPDAAGVPPGDFWVAIAPQGTRLSRHFRARGSWRVLRSPVEVAGEGLIDNAVLRETLEGTSFEIREWADVPYGERPRLAILRASDRPALVDDGGPGEGG